MSIGETRQGTNERGKWKMTPVVFTWKEESFNADPYDQSVVMDVSGEIDLQKVQEAINRQEEVTVNIWFSTSTNKEGTRQFTNIRGSVPKEFIVQPL